MIIPTLHPKVEVILNNMERVIVGKREEIILCLTALLADGHVLLEDVPGVGKTMLVKSLAKSVSSTFKRIQFTPDLLPSDVLGVSIYNPKALEFEFRPGPIMGNIILADEINRTSPKTQSALLEGMEEKSVTIDGHTFPLPRPFLVMATQNPIEYEGTYPLPEAQLDRFLLKIYMGYPSFAEEMEVLSRVQEELPIQELTPVITLDELLSMQKEVKGVFVDDTIKQYIISIVTRTRNHPQIYLGVSPRGSIALMKASKSYAYIQGRDFVLPDDIQFLAPFVFSHRMILQSQARYDGVNAEEIISSILSDTKVPIQKVVK
ncbi:MoxR family ATPase [Caldibacillus thermoamylovorans]|uniref:AAA family ATPase n=1 Tax=Caldibacillus thermoamylovorans TaxID=35841 RepID=UPI001D08942A|nr:MoxR family ATPase [Caldibacillus thermoamylovorans]MCB5935671.1 MoxR family ATPase [Bacillus sp. DFI.2.34]MCB7077795.1 MoxR family ATPase [Caldibacillus thermoamylovorans]